MSKFSDASNIYTEIALTYRNLLMTRGKSRVHLGTIRVFHLPTARLSAILNLSINMKSKIKILRSPKYFRKEKRRRVNTNIGKNQNHREWVTWQPSAKVLVYIFLDLNLIFTTTKIQQGRAGQQDYRRGTRTNYHYRLLREEKGLATGLRVGMRVDQAIVAIKDTKFKVAYGVPQNS